MTESRTGGAVPAYFGTVLRRGSTGPDTAQVQCWLAGLEMEKVQPGKVDGCFGRGTETAVKTFQTAAGLESDGQVGRKTWDALYGAYCEKQGPGEVWPGIPLKRGDSGAAVKSMQQKLADLSKVYGAIPAISADGAFGGGTAGALAVFQQLFGLKADSVLGKQSFEALMLAWQAAQTEQPLKVPAPYGGRTLTVGSTGSSVRIAQSWLAKMGPCIPIPAIDGQFGQKTRDSVLAFQARGCIGADGVLGRVTWEKLREGYNEQL